MRLYWEVAKRGFQRYATYRGATVAGVFTNTIFGFIRAYILLEVFRSRPQIGSFDAADALTYTFIVQGMIMIVQMWGWTEIENRVRSGDIGLDLMKPYSFLGYWLAGDFGRAAFQGLSRGLPPILIGAVFFDLVWPSPVIWPAIMVSVVLAVVVSFGIRMILNLLAFWIVEARGVAGLAYVLIWFFSGFVLPLELFPASLQAFARALPFAAILNTPIEVFLHKYDGVELLGVLGFQAFWAVAMLLVGQFVLRAGTRKLVIQGG